MSNIRDISKARILSLETLSKSKVILSDIKHMVIDDSAIDLDKGQNWLEIAAAERITKDPKRQSCNENEQLKTLLTVFPYIDKPDQTTYLYDGKLIIDIEKIKDDDPPDIDADDIKDIPDGYTMVVTCKGGQDWDGTAQHRQFMNVLKTIQQAPILGSSSKVLLAVFVSGSFWTKSNRKKYKNFKMKQKKFSLIDIINDKIFDKKVIVFSDQTVPTSAAVSKLIQRDLLLQVFYSGETR